MSTDSAVVFDLTSYIPESLLPGYSVLKESVASYLELLGLVGPEIESKGAGEYSRYSFKL